jgi:ABC-type glutathione transport system ATPase component
MGMLGFYPGIVAGKIIFKDENLTEGIEKICEIERDNKGKILRIIKNTKRWDKEFGYERRYKDLRGKVIGIVPQGVRAALNPYMKIKKQLQEAYFISHKNKSLSEMNRVKDEVLSRLNIKDKENLYAHQLSGGMCQRVLIACGILQAPELLIIDEPTILMQEVIAVIKDFKENKLIPTTDTYHKKHTILLISHEDRLIKNICDRIISL